MAHSASRLLNEHPTGKLLAVTFTRDAAQSLKQRILTTASRDVSQRLAVGTLHSLALTQLKRAGQMKALASPMEQAMMVRKAVNNCPEAISIEEASMLIDGFKSSLRPHSNTNPTANMLYKLYVDYMEQAGLIDFADLLILASLGMKDGSIKPFKADWLLVDEAQDLDEVQMEWVDLHRQSGMETMLVADDDQSIYGWRNAMGYKGLIDFKKKSRADLITLPVNYRCDQRIILKTSVERLFCYQGFENKYLLYFFESHQMGEHATQQIALL